MRTVKELEQELEAQIADNTRLYHEIERYRRDTEQARAALQAERDAVLKLEVSLDTARATNRRLSAVLEQKDTGGS